MNVSSRNRGKRALLAGSLVALSVAAVGGLRLAFAADDHSDTPGRASIVPQNGSISGTLGSPSDLDWFQVQGSLAGQGLQVTVVGDSFLPGLTVVDGGMQVIAQAPAGGVQSMGPTGWMVMVPAGVRDPVRMKVSRLSQLGRYTLTTQIVPSSGGGIIVPPTPPPAPVPPPVPPPPPPPPPAPPTDDVPPGEVRDFSSTGVANGRLENAGDTDEWTYIPFVDGTYGLRLTSPDGSLTEAVAELAIPNGPPVQLATWFQDPVTVDLLVGQHVAMSVHSLGDSTGAYRIEVTPPTGITPPVSQDLTLPVDARQDMLARPSRMYLQYEWNRFRIRDRSISGELVAALAARDRWIQKDRGETTVSAYTDSSGAIDGALSRFGTSTATIVRGFNAYFTQLMAGCTPGGGTTAQVGDTVRAALTARRPLLLAGRRSDGLMEAWVVVGIETSFGLTNLRVLDPSVPGASTLIPMDAEAGILPYANVVGYFLTGGDKDTLP